ncbi:hypothetical protein [Vibrio scophthalmi]|uniref:Uncharacterized protein n=1 Tax=Vibrio scophthalmi LMG 19158 TaxID=870967 RepID=F9RP48_9VIBR|nr:hypothetical protein [Vibrio scophthalmi]EGU36155.1 hypothetical protein VIS19158_10369 [Vibrio scophthalmi LMG 19158]
MFKFKPENIAAAKAQMDTSFWVSLVGCIIIAIVCLYIYAFDPLGEVGTQPKEKSASLKVQEVINNDKFSVRINGVCPGLERYSEDLSSFKFDEIMTTAAQIDYITVKDNIKITQNEHGDVSWLDEMYSNNPADRPWFVGSWLAFKVSESPTAVPIEYRAMGHTCRIGISHDGQYVRIGKQPCISLCLAKPTPPLNQDLILKFE